MKFTPPSVMELIADIEAITKRAEADITSEHVEGQDPGSMPGAENDKKTPSEMKDPDPEVVDETVGGESNYSADGAAPGSDNKQLNPQLLDSEEQVLNPDRKAQESAEADAKTAAAAGNDIVNMILESKKKEAQTAKKAASPAPAPAPEKAPAKEPEAKAVEKKPEAPKAEAKPACAGAKCASSEEPIVFSGSVLEKLAAVWLSTKEGRDQCADMLANMGGREFAQRSLDALAEKKAEDEYMAAFQKGAQAAEEAIGDFAEAQGAADAEAAIGDAAEAQGAADADAALAGEGGEGGLPPDTTVEDVIAVTADLLQSGQITEDQAVDVLEAAGVPMDGNVESGDVVDEFSDMVASGQIPPDVAQAVLEQLGAEDASAAAGEGEAAPAEPEAPADAGPADPGAEQAAAELDSAAKEAAVKKIAAAIKTAEARRKAVSDLTNTLMGAIRQKQAKAAAKK